MERCAILIMLKFNQPKRLRTADEVTANKRKRMWIELIADRICERGDRDDIDLQTTHKQIVGD